MIKDTKRDRKAKAVHEGLTEAGLTYKVTSEYNHETEVTDPKTGKHFATITFRQKYSFDTCTIRVTHAGMRHSNENSFSARRHRADPFYPWNWSGRNYQITASAVNAVVLFMTGIPSPGLVKLAKLRDKMREAWSRKRSSEKNFQQSFGSAELIALLAKVPPHEFTRQRKALESLNARIAEVSKAEKKVDKAEKLLGEA